ncbi:PREDICTED: transcription elongation factor B polypeptide 3-like, partial [Galeopterus variegatus]|uniref:Transcription elongation factor B polypeptide 3-like n=1 Tax=Galeopterus variegatus TaxID=482537 RepID=A0ABM0Q522_GALVR
MAADGALHAVVKLQVRLAAHSDPKKLAKYLKKLSALPVTAHTLAETGVRKTVKRLRTHQHVGSLARDLAAQWKKLLVVARDTRPEQLAFEESRSRKRRREEFPKEPKVQGACPESHGASESPSDGTEHGRRKHRRLSQPQTPPKGSSAGGDPCPALEPAWEGCTPDQPGRIIEKYNPTLAKETDPLWKRRCQRDFKEARPEEHESWREMYLRLREARERRLRLVTMKIRSARAEKPRGRQTQMIFFHS